MKRQSCAYLSFSNKQTSGQGPKEMILRILTALPLKSLEKMKVKELRQCHAQGQLCGQGARQRQRESRLNKVRDIRYSLINICTSIKELLLSFFVMLKICAG